MNKIDGIIKHYVELFNNHMFDEYDVAGFLIIIRNDNLRAKQPYIYDFANIVAHRTRTEGVAFNAMKKAIDNKFAINLKGRVIGFCGPSYASLKKEIESLADKYGYICDEEFCKEFILCLMSIGQDVMCEEDGKMICELKLSQGLNNKLSLDAMGEDASVCYSLYNPKYNFENEYSAGLITEAVEAIRDNGKLELHFCESGDRV